MYSASSELKGRMVINSFLSKYRDYNNASITQDYLFSKILKYDQTLFLKTLGSGFENGLESDSDKLDSAMDNLASDTKGGLPTTDSFFEAMRGQIGGFKVYVEALTASASEIGSGLQAVGNSAINTGKILTYLLPVLAVVVVVYVGKSYADKLRAK